MSKILKISIQDYHADKEHISATSLKLAKKSLALFKMYRDGELEEENKSHFDFGNAFELCLLDSNAGNYIKIFDADERPEPDKTFASKLNKLWKEEFFNTDKYIINKAGKESFETIEKMLRSCYQDAAIQKLIKNIDYQSSLYWTDKNGLKLKSRPDICQTKKNIIVDVKTTRDGSPEAFSRDLKNFDYPLQAIMQIEGVLATGYMPSVDMYLWLVVEKEPPYSATLYEFTLEDQRWITDEYEYVKKILKQAIDKEFYPSYTQRADNEFGILTAQIPLYYKTL